MISIERSKDFDIVDVLRRSPVSGIPGARETLLECMSRSVEVQIGIVDGVVACVWGMIPVTILSSSAYLWLLTTDLVEKHKFLFIRHSQRCVEEALKIFPVITGDVAPDNHSARRWLEWLGAEFSSGPFGDWIPFTIRRRDG